MALEHVAQGQTRFFTPGVAPDPRGILLGRLCLMTFPTLEGAVSWLRLYSSEASLDELMAGLTITKAQHRARQPRDRGPDPGGVVVRGRSRGAAGAARRRRDLHRHREALREVPRRSLAVRLRRGRHRRDAGARPTSWSTATSSRRATSREGDLPFARLLFRLSIRKMPGGEQLGARGSRRAVPRGRARPRRRHHPLPVAQPRRGAGRPVHAALARARSTITRAIAATCGSARATCRSASSRCSSARPASTCSGPPARTPRSRSATSIRSISRRAQSVFPADTFHVFWPGRSRRRAARAARAQRHRRSDARRSRARASRAIRRAHSGGAGRADRRRAASSRPRWARRAAWSRR